jgi:hypothetical protein
MWDCFRYQMGDIHSWLILFFWYLDYDDFDDEAGTGDHKIGVEVPIFCSILNTLFSR